MNIRFYYDPETTLPHIYNHNVDAYELTGKPLTAYRRRKRQK
jgi:hypothetical protein